MNAAGTLRAVCPLSMWDSASASTAKHRLVSMPVWGVSKLSGVPNASVTKSAAFTPRTPARAAKRSTLAISSTKLSAKNILLAITK